jgi:hypothetical protein
VKLIHECQLAVPDSFNLEIDLRHKLSRMSMQPEKRRSWVGVFLHLWPSEASEPDVDSIFTVAIYVLTTVQKNPYYVIGKYEIQRLPREENMPSSGPLMIQTGGKIAYGEVIWAWLGIFDSIGG